MTTKKWYSIISAEMIVLQVKTYFMKIETFNRTTVFLYFSSFSLFIHPFQKMGMIYKNSPPENQSPEFFITFDYWKNKGRQLENIILHSTAFFFFCLLGPESELIPTQKMQTGRLPI